MYLCKVIINIYTKLNGVGLQADAELLKAILSSHDVLIIDWERPRMKRACDIGIHLEHIRREFIALAKVNINIPNPEWFEARWQPLLRYMNAVLCKTHYTYDIFSRMHGNCIYIGWTSTDRYVPGIDKRMMCLHLAG